MRTTLVILLALGLLAGPAALAVAQADADAETRAQKAKDRRAELKAARDAVLDAFRANRTAILDAYHASLNATKATFLAHKERVQAECAAKREAFDNNSAADDKPDHAQCMRHLLKPYADEARAANKAARELAHETLKDERAKGMKEWAKRLRDANDRHGRPA